jgi:hypothetical protein
MSRDGNGPSATEDAPERETLREGLRRGILDALALELDRTSARTVGRLAAAGALGIAGALGSVALFSGGLLANGHHGWYVAICAAVWAGFLVACSSVALLRIQIQRIPLTQACVLALVGLGLAALLAVLCPDPHPLTWWSATSVGRLAIAGGGPGAGAFCLGACSALGIGAGARVVLALRGVSFRGATLPAIFLALMLWPAVLLQTSVAPAPVVASGSAGLFAGCYAGVALGRWPARWLLGRST